MNNFVWSNIVAPDAELSSIILPVAAAAVMQ